jgi:hypothetical protein
MSGIEQIKNLVIPDGRVPIAAYQAIYHRITQNTERLSSVKKGAYKVSRDDIENLKRIIEQTVQQYRVEAKSEEINLVFSDGEHESYSSFERFKIANFRVMSGQTVSFNYTFDFLIIIPVEINNIPDIAQRYRASISIATPTEDDIHIYKFYRNDHQRIIGSFEIEIEYADRSVANNLGAQISLWSDTVKISTGNEESNRVFKAAASVLRNSSLILVLSMLFGSMILDPSLYGNHFTPVRYLIFVVMLCTLVGFVGDKISDYAREAISSVTQRNRFDISLGDEKAYSSLKAKISRSKSISYIILTCIVLSFPMGLLVNYVSNIIFLRV